MHFRRSQSGIRCRTAAGLVVTLTLATFACRQGPAGKSAVGAADTAAAGADTALGPTRFAWFDFARDVGTAAIDSTGRFCLSLPANSLGKGERVWLVSPGADPQTVAQARVTRAAPECALPDAQRDEHGYLLGSFTGGAEPGETMIALARPIGLPQVSGRRAVGDIDGDGALETFRECTSSEGIHLTIWSAPDSGAAPAGGNGATGATAAAGTPRSAGTAGTGSLAPGGPPAGQRRWHRYHYLGYDVEPTCTAAETR